MNTLNINLNELRALEQWSEELRQRFAIQSGDEVTVTLEPIPGCTREIIGMVQRVTEQYVSVILTGDSVPVLVRHSQIS